MNKEELVGMINDGMSSREIAKKINKSQTSVNYWIKKFNLRTNPSFYKTEPKCTVCGEIDPGNFYGHYKSTCKKCFNKIQSDRFRSVRRAIVEEQGGKCSICGYNKYIGALEFHHLDPSKKDPLYSSSKCWGIDRIRKEVENCVLLCSNCHREIEAGVTIYAE